MKDTVSDCGGQKVVAIKKKPKKNTKKKGSA